MRVVFSRAMAVAVTAVTVSALSGCTTMGRVPGANYVTGWWKSPASETYARNTPTPSEQSNPIVTVSQGNASAGPVDIANRQYGPSSTGTQTGGYATQPAGAIQPNYANDANPYAAVAANHGYQGATSTQVAPVGQSQSNSIYGNSSPQANPYSNPYGSSAYQTADARNGAYGSSPPAASPAPSSAYGTESPASSIQPYNGYQGGSQPYGNPTPPPSYTPPAGPAAGGYGPSGYSANTTTGAAAPLSQPPTDGYAPFGTSRHEGPAEVENLTDNSGYGNVSPAGYQGQSAPAEDYNSNPYGNSGYGNAPNAYQPSSQPLY